MIKINEWVAVNLSRIFATMWTFWLINLLCLLPLVWAPSLPAVQFISSGWFQAVALPLLAVSAVIIGKQAEARAEQDHEAIMEELGEIREILKDVQQVLAAQKTEQDILAHIEGSLAKLVPPGA